MTDSAVCCDHDVSSAKRILLCRDREAVEARFQPGYWIHLDYADRSGVSVADVGDHVLGRRRRSRRRHASAVRHQVDDAEKGRRHAMPYRVSVLGELLDGGCR
jgi:hypothetical protein